MNAAELNKKYTPLNPEDRIKMLYADFPNVLFTSSFGVSSVYLLHLVSRLNPAQMIFFLDTTYHFKETADYKQLLTERFQLNVTELKGDSSRNLFTQLERSWEKDPDLCCSVNKVEPLDAIKPGYGVWISGLMKSQNQHRNELTLFEERNGMMKFYPILDQTNEDVKNYISMHNLPEHPLKARGFQSVGCTHCTSRGTAREGRWVNKSKTECGLHL
jgi:phosphoadenosine phosphosulfate reductase